MKGENQTNIRRIIVGAVEILLAFIIYNEANTASNVYALTNSNSGSFAATSGIMVAFACAITGIILIVTAKNNYRWAFWLVLIITVLFWLLGIMSSTKYFEDLAIFSWGYLILTGIALIKFGKKKANIQNETEKVATQERQDSNQELRKLKKLADDGIITQDEFEAKKKQLLGL